MEILALFGGVSAIFAAFGAMTEYVCEVWQ